MQLPTNPPVRAMPKLRLQALGNFSAIRIRPIFSVDYAMGIKKALLKDMASAREEGRSSVCSVARLVRRSRHCRRAITGF